MDELLANEASAAAGVARWESGGIVVTAVGLTDIGCHRQVNQDSLGNLVRLYADHTAELGLLFAIADGMGGHSRGEVASDLAMKNLFAHYYASDPHGEPQQALAQALLATNAAVHEAGRTVGGGNMGTTLTAALFRAGRLYVANIGDSRTYRLREGQSEQLTHDHSLIGEQVRSGILTEAQARQSNIRNVITRAVGYRPHVEADIFSYPLAIGDIILLCSDGLHGPVEDGELTQILSTHDLPVAVQQLIDLARERGGLDNITALAIRVDALPTTNADDPERTRTIATLPRLSDDVTVPFSTIEQTAPMPMPQPESAPPPSPNTGPADERATPATGTPPADELEQTDPDVTRRRKFPFWFGLLLPLLLLTLFVGAVVARGSLGTPSPPAATGPPTAPRPPNTTANTTSEPLLSATAAANTSPAANLAPAPAEPGGPASLVTIQGTVTLAGGLATTELTQYTVVLVARRPPGAPHEVLGAAPIVAAGPSYTYRLTLTRPVQPGVYQLEITKMGDTAMSAELQPAELVIASGQQQYQHDLTIVRLPGQ